MFVLLLFTTAMGLNLTEFKSFQIEFSENCTNYILLQNKSSYLGLFQRNNQFELWLTQNDTYECYTASHSDSFKFDWPEKLINGVEMKLVLQDGWIKYPMDFDSENIMCPIKGINTIAKKELEKVFKCLPSNDWIINMLIVGIVILLVILFGVQHESIKTILGPKISWLIWRVGKVLSRGEEEVSSSDQEGNWKISEISERLHTP